MKEIAITDFENLKIGQAENAGAGTGCTVLLLGKDGAPTGLDVRGGGPASRESELLKTHGGRRCDPRHPAFRRQCLRTGCGRRRHAVPGGAGHRI